MTPAITHLPDQVQAQIRSSSKITSVNDVILCLLRNSLDAGASKVIIDVDYRRRGCVVEDNGAGIPPSEFRADGGLAKMYREWTLTNLLDYYLECAVVYLSRRRHFQV